MTNETKQTAVEWFAQQLGITTGTMLDQAKAMEREHIENAWLDAWKESMINPLADEYYKPDAEQYYNETYGKSNT